MIIAKPTWFNVGWFFIDSDFFLFGVFKSILRAPWAPYKQKNLSRSWSCGVQPDSTSLNPWRSGDHVHCRILVKFSTN